MNVRWPLVSSIIALFAGIGLAVLVLAVCNEGAEGPGELEARIAATRTAATRTAIAGARTATADTLAATQAPADETPTPEPPTTTPTPEGPEATPTPTPVLLPDLLILELGVFHDQIVVVVSNVGNDLVPAGSQVEVGVRSIVAESVILDEPLLPGDSFTSILSDQVIYQPEVVLAVVDPNDLITEEDENNSLTRSLEPDITPDLGLVGIAAVGDDRLLAVDVANTTEAPIRQALVILRAFRCDDSSPIAEMSTIIDLEPQGVVRIEILPEVIVARRVCMQVTMEVADIPDADLDNNEYEGRIR